LKEEKNVLCFLIKRTECNDYTCSINSGGECEKQIETIR